MSTFDTIVSEILRIPVSEIRDSLTPKDIPEWDSMNYLLFIAELEKQFNISFTMDETFAAGSLGAVKEILRSKGASV